jgi:DNA polymerase III subunit delta
MSSRGTRGPRRRQEMGGVFFLTGEDQFRKEEEGKSLVEMHLDPATRDFNFDSLRGGEVAVETLASVLATPPMMAQWRVVLLRDMEALASNSRARQVLLDVASKPPPGLALILLATPPRGSEAKLYKELRRLARSVDFPAIDPNDVPGWLVEWTARKHERTLTEEAARALGAAVGTDLGVLAQELAKLASLVEEGSPIGVEAVRAAGTEIPAEDRWEWFDRVGRRDLAGALGALGTLFGQGETGVGLTIGLATHLLRVGVAATGGKRALEALLSPHQKWLAPRLMQQARGWSVQDLEEALVDLRRADRLLKSSSLSERHVLEEWILGLMAREAAMAP